MKREKDTVSNHPAAQPLFLSCDWGTSVFRLRLVAAGDLAVRSAVEEGQGIARTYAAWQAAGGGTEAARRAFYLSVFLQQAGRLEVQAGVPLRSVPVVISGMASSTLGMQELPYTQVPFAVDGSDLRVAQLGTAGAWAAPVVLVSGARTEHDVMRGEETQLVGGLAEAGAVEGMWVFPGTHSKHIRVEGGRVVEFTTYMTGEFFSLLSTHSILAATVERGAGLPEGRQLQAFEKGVRDSREANLLHASFRVRTNHLLQHMSREDNYHYLSGLLIGAELGGLRRDLPLTVVSSEPFRTLYAAALEVLERSGRTQWVDADRALVQGQFRIARRFIQPAVPGS